MSWLQNDMFNELVEEARQDEEEARMKAETDALLAEFDRFDRTITEDRIYEDIDIDDEIIENAINQEYWDVAWYATCSRHRLVEDLIRLRQGGRTASL